MKYLVFDISNILYRTFHHQPDEDDITLAGLAAHSALMTLNKYYRQHKPNKIVMCFDGESWRKGYTAQFPYLKPYKGNRRQNMTPSQQAKYIRFITHLSDFKELITNHTTVTALYHPNLEADDLIAGFVQQHQEDDCIIISADSDLAQLQRYSNVTLISPATDKIQATLDKYDNDPLYYLFQKCIRGDSTDNIQSAYPRVRSTRIKEVFEDTFKRTNFMKEEWTNQHGETFTVEQMFDHNVILIDLEKQPEEFKTAITDTITTELENKKKFSYFHILKFLGKYQLTKIKENLDNFLPILSS